MKKLLFLICGLSILPSRCTNLINNGTVPFTISESGTYLVAEDISYVPTSATPMILVNASQVTIDLLGFTAQQTAGFGFSCTGIQIAPGAVDIFIRNGKLKGFTQSGISANAGGSGNLNVDNVRVVACGNRAIEFLGTVASPMANNTISNCLLNSCTVTTADNVLTLSNINESIIRNVQINECLSGGVITSTFVLVKMTNCLRTQLFNVSGSNNIGNFDARGFSCNACDACIFNNCIVNGLTAGGGGSNAQGFVLESNNQSLNGTCTANIFQYCIANNVTGTNTVDGFFSGTGNNDNRFEFCQSLNQLAQGVSSACSGFRVVNNSRNFLQGCMAMTCSSLSTVAAPFYGTYGYKIDTTTGTALTQCIADSNTAAVAGKGVGFFIFATTQCSILQCASNHNTVGFDGSNLTAGAAGTYNGQAFVQNTALKNLSANYNTNANAWPGNSNGNVANNALNSLNVSWQNVGII